MPRRFILTAAAIVVLMFPGAATALTMEQVTSFCQSYNVDCSQSPFLQAYVGGALDLIAMLAEETEYLAQIYCEEPKTFFDVPAIIRYMLKHQAEYADRNAMLLLIRYLEEKGGCWP